MVLSRQMSSVYLNGWRLLIASLLVCVLAACDVPDTNKPVKVIRDEQLDAARKRVDEDAEEEKATKEQKGNNQPKFVEFRQI